MHLVGCLSTGYFSKIPDPTPVHVPIKADASRAASLKLGEPNTHSRASTPEMSENAAEIAVILSEQCVALGFALPRAY